MQIVIDIPEDVYKKTVFYREFRNLNDCVTTIKALENGTPLPKGHGRLIDADDAKSYFSDREGDDFTAFHFYDAVESTPTIIEADNLENEEHEHMTADEFAELFTERDKE